MTEEEFLLRHQPAADLVFQLLQQIGDSFYKSKMQLYNGERAQMQCCMQIQREAGF